MNDQINELVEFMQELASDSNVPRNVKTKFNESIASLKTINKDNFYLTKNKLLSELDDVASDANLDSFTRQQIWSITSMLEGLEL